MIKNFGKKLDEKIVHNMIIKEVIDMIILNERIKNERSKTR